MPRKPKPGQSLAEVNPELAEEWHPTKNGDLTPYDVSPGSKALVWWKCSKGDDHEFETAVQTRLRTKCPICSGHKVVISNCLATLNPTLAKEWHPTMNGDLTPEDITTGSNKEIWWQCSENTSHIWKTNVKTRTKEKIRCKFCRKEKYIPKKPKPGQSLAEVNPQLAKEWHTTKNGDSSPYDVSSGSKALVWWKCPKGDDHEWQSTIKNRTLNGNGCGICYGKIVVPSTSLLIKYPEIADQWHPTKNGSASPDKIHFGSNTSFWWKCDKAGDHVWKTRLADRIDGHNCPMCSGNIVVPSNSLSKLNPGLASEWHPTLNGDDTPENYTVHSGKKVWWQCKKDNLHVWQAQINNRTITNCPYCELTPQSREELTITFELIKIFKDINPKGHKLKVKGKLRSIDIFIPHLSIGVEFDGHYWHKDKREKDKMKTLDIMEQGINIIRVRQKPLKRIFEDDVMAEKKFDGKQITNDILKQIMKDYDLDKRTLTKIDNYMSKEGLQNQKGLDNYIDQILTEKAERKKNT